MAIKTPQDLPVEDTGMRSGDLIEKYNPVSGVNEKVDYKNWNSEGSYLSPGRIAFQEYKSTAKTVSGRYKIAIVPSGQGTTPYRAEFTVSVFGDFIEESFTVRVSGAVSSASTKNVKIEILDHPYWTETQIHILGMYLGKSDVAGSGAVLEADLDFVSGNNYITTQMRGNSSNITSITTRQPFQLIEPVISDGLLPDGVTAATFIEAGEELRTRSGSPVNSPRINFTKVSNDQISLVFDWSQIPKQSTAITLSYTNLILYEYTSVLFTYSFDGSETIGAVDITDNEITVPITKVSAFTNFTNAGNTIRANTLVATLT